MQNHFDVIVIGAGHAGCEAAWAAARLGRRVLLTTISLDSVAYLACNPSVGGTAKGHLVCEIDALGGIMGVVADKSALQARMLNTTKGAAVFSLRAQVDNIKYPQIMRQTLESIENITIKQGEVTEILTSNCDERNNIRNTNSESRQTIPIPKAVSGVTFSTGETITCSSVVIAAGVYLNSEIFVGENRKDSGPAGFANSKSLTNSLINLGLEIRRFKTATPPRVDSNTVDFAKTEPHLGDDNIRTFSYLTTKPIKNVIECHLTHTNVKTNEIINNNLHLNPMYNDRPNKGIGPRYCPDIDDKVVRFPDRDRHQIFLEPESLSTNAIYLQGLSTSFPTNIQEQIVRSIEGLENAQILRNAYGIEYNCINSLQLLPTLEYKGCKGLFFAGQVNGTSGYEEAAAQGLVAGVNAGLALHSGLHSLQKSKRSEHQIDAGTSDRGTQVVYQGFTLSRTESYIGVLVDDLVTVGTDEPYRMFTSRAEHRLYLRQDNADQRLTPIGRKIGLVCDHRWKVYQKKMKLLEKARVLLQADASNRRSTQSEASKQSLSKIPKTILDIIGTEQKYDGYIKRELSKIAEAKRCEATLLPADIDYNTVKGICSEACGKLNKIRPQNIGQASRITGVTPADINVLLIWLKKNKNPH